MRACAFRFNRPAGLATALIVSCLATVEPVLAESYLVTNLGTLGGAGSHAAAINDAGQVVGDAYTKDGAQHAFLYNDREMTDLGTLGGANSFATGINRSGQIVGYSDTAGNTAQHATLWIGATVIDLGTLGGRYSAAYGVNDAGEIVGSTSTPTIGPHAARWFGTVAVDIGSNLAAFSVARGVNASGDVVGQQNNPEPLAYVWNGPLVSQLSTSNLGDGTSDALAINDAGEVVGRAQVSALPLAPAHAVIWASTTARSAADLGTLGGIHSVASGINAAGQIVGSADTSSGAPHATLWVGGRATDLNERLSPALRRHVVLIAAAAINGHGWIVADGVDSRTLETTAYLLMPRHAVCRARDRGDLEDGERRSPQRARSEPASTRELDDREKRCRATIGMRGETVQE
jgi:probable HAF family extracellular repeat protein